jgi:hypothetical protein
LPVFLQFLIENILKITTLTPRWSLIGKMSPKRPQAFYPVSDSELSVNSGDYLAARCTMVITSFFSA